ncbi:MAG TPA: DUF692 domain-containing protein [Kofleriaceae bacterium]|nr:DUF692 domain-containing protein [Kofleriaceae bacterium]
MTGSPADRVGLSWRPELAAGILAHLDQIDLVELMTDDLLAARSADRRALDVLRAQLPVVLHGVGLGLASSDAVDPARLDRVARVVERFEPLYWSEHLAFVRAGGIEIGHLAAPPRTDATIEGTARNLARARRAVGTLPLMENVATLLEPPASRYGEAEWTARVLAASGCELLLDLHNLHANAHNGGFSAESFLAAIDLGRVGAVHLAGGRIVRRADGETRVVDDHLHAVPAAVLELLSEIAARAPRPLAVIIERDGHYPPFGELLAEVAAARRALERGRLRRAGWRP